MRVPNLPLQLLGLELVKIILFTMPYVMVSSAKRFEGQASALLEKTDIIASTPHSLVDLVDPFSNSEDKPMIISLLQKQLQGCAVDWEKKLACIPRPWEKDPQGPKHPFPQLIIPNPVVSGPRTLLPQVYLSVYNATQQQDVETVPPTTDVASCLLRDALADTINILDVNRLAAARLLIDVDCYFAPDTFVKRATPFDRLRDDDRTTTWKPEDVAVDAVFSQLFQLPAPEHKLVYYHSVLTECCKIAPAAIAPSLGRAIRFLYTNLEVLDLEVCYRFLDWFAHHLSNFGFTWKWSEW